MTRYLLFALLIMFAGRAVMRLFSGIVEGFSGQPGASRALDHGVQMVRDPVCGTFVVPSRARTLREGDRVQYFCSEKCQTAYRATSRANST